jgi:glycosyltransferase involved in cell wall biosynthesis
MDKVLEKYKLSDRIHITGYVKDEHVSAIYRNALCFIFPSLYEGFGLPPVEALALGTPVIASDAASIPEILMEQAVYFKNNSYDELEDLLMSLNEIVGSMPKELNRYQKENYRFEKSADKVLEFIKA